MKGMFLRAMGLTIFLSMLVCWGSMDLLYGEKADKAVVAIKYVGSVSEWTSRSNSDVYLPVIPVAVKNNTSQRIKGVSVVLFAYDKQKKKLFESSDFGCHIDDSEMGKWKQDDQSIKGRNSARLVCMLPERLSPWRKEFKEKYGKPKYYVVELFVASKLIDVMAKPKNFFKHSNRSEREERLKEWEGAK